MPLIKISDALFAKLGVDNPADSEAAIAILIEETQTTKTMDKQKLETLEVAINALAATCKTFGEELKGLKAAAPDAEKIKTDAVDAAKAEASKVVSSAIAKTGIAPHQPAADAAPQSEDKPAAGKVLNFSELVSQAEKEKKLPKHKAFSEVIRSNPAAYAEHLKTLGVAK